MARPYDFNFDAPTYRPGPRRTSSRFQTGQGLDDYEPAAETAPAAQTSTYSTDVAAQHPRFYGGQPQAPVPTGPYSGYGPSNAFIDPSGQVSPNQGINAIIADFYRQGAFDPSGQGGYLDSIKQMLAEQERQDVAQAGLTSDIYGGDDPLARLYGRLTAEQGARNRYPGLIAQAQAEAARRREDELFRLLEQRLGNVTYQREQRPDYGALLGELGGTVIGGLLGGPGGAAAGGAIPAISYPRRG